MTTHISKQPGLPPHAYSRLLASPNLPKFLRGEVTALEAAHLDAFPEEIDPREALARIRGERGAASGLQGDHDRAPTELRYGHSFSSPSYRVAHGLTVWRINWLWLTWLAVCLGIGAAFAYYFQP